MQHMFRAIFSSYITLKIKTGEFSGSIMDARLPIISVVIPIASQIKAFFAHSSSRDVKRDFSGAFASFAIRLSWASNG